MVCKLIDENVLRYSLTKITILTLSCFRSVWAFAFIRLGKLPFRAQPRTMELGISAIVIEPNLRS